MSEEYMRRHYGVVPPTAETPRFSNPENLNRRLAATKQTLEPKIRVRPEPQLELINLTAIDDPENLDISWTKRLASGKRTIRKSDVTLVIRDENPQLLL